MSNSVNVPADKGSSSQTISNIYSNNGPVVVVSEAHGGVSASTNNSLGNIEPKRICFRWKDSYANFTGRLDELNRLEAATINCQDISDSKSSKIVAVFGLGGIGKTQLVRKFIERHRKHYKNVIWINAETESSMVDDFENLAENHLEISTKVDGKHKDIETLLQEVFNKLSTLSTVIVFDNVDEAKNTKVIGFVLTSGIRPHVIITSRIRTWSDSICRIKLNVFNDQEAVQYVSTKLIDPDSVHNDSYDDKMKLVETLQHFPLALTQAVAHINYHRDEKDFHISQYLCEWNSFLGSNFFQNDDLNTYDQTTLTTWNVTIAAIRKCGAPGDLALRILRIISYFDPNHIRRDIFFNLKVPEVHMETEVISAVRLLVKYSMVDSLRQQSVLSIHRLVQQVTKIELEKNLDTKVSILRDSLDIIWKMRQHPKFKECLDHGTSVFCMALACEELIQEYTKVPAVLITSLNDQGKYMRAMDFGHEVTKQLTRIVGENHEDVLGSHLSTTSTSLYLCKYNEALRTFQELLEKQKKVLRENHPETLRCEVNIAVTYGLLGKYEEAIQINQSVFEKRKIVLGENHPKTLMMKSNIGTLYVSLGRYSDALQIHQEVFEKRKTVLKKNHRDTVISMSNIGCIYYSLGKYSDAMQMLQEVFEKRKTILGVHHTKTLKSESYVANIHFSLGEYSKALEMHKAVFEKRQTMLAENNLKLMDSMSYIAIAYSGLGRHFEALQMLQEVSVKLSSLLGEDNQKTLDNLSHIAASYSNVGKHYDALEQHRQVFEKWKCKLGIYHQHTLIINFNFAVIHSCVGEYSTSLQMHQEVYEKRKHIFGDDHPHTLDSKFRIAILQNTLGKHTLALGMHLEVYSRRKTILGENHPDTLNSTSKIADIYSSMGNVPKALELHQEALTKQTTSLGDCHPHTLNSMSSTAALYSFQGKYSRAIRMYTEVSEKRKSILGDDHPHTRLDNLLIKLCREDMKSIIEQCANIGLHINPDKCELYFCSEVDQHVVQQFNDMSPGICIVNEFTLLGAPISDNAFEGVFRKKLDEMKLLFERLLELENYHIAFFILKNCFAIPKLIFLLRASPTNNHNELINEVDSEIKIALESLTNSKLDANTWMLASLPVNSGGLGVRRVQDTALPAFLSSVNSVIQLVSTMLHHPTLQVDEIDKYNDALNEWNILHPEQSHPELPSLQRQWTKIETARLVSELNFDSDEDKARFLAIQTPESGAWLQALPAQSLGTLLDNNAFRITVGLRLGLDICAPHICRCGSQVNSKGRHGLKCRNKADRLATHAGLNNIIKRALVSADVPAKLEPVGLVRDDGKRVDGMSLIPWTRGSILIWDATVTDTLAPSNVHLSSKKAGSAADNKARRKEVKYRSLLSQNYYFVPFAVETMGSWSSDAIHFFNTLGRKLAVKSSEPRSKSFLKQRVSIAIQRGNAAAVMGTFRDCDKMNEIFYLL